MAVYRSSCRDKHNRPQCDSNLGPLTAVGHASYVLVVNCRGVVCSLDPDEDPLCMLLLLDFYALRSEQYDFLVRMYTDWEDHRNLSQLPNFAFSVPLAMFHQAVRDAADQTKADDMVSLQFWTDFYASTRPVFELPSACVYPYLLR